MKKLFFVCLLIISFYGYSQDVKYGVRGGLNISNLAFEEDPIMVNDHRNSFYVGFFAEIDLTQTISLHPELQFSPEGAKLEVLHLDYIQAPILLKLKLMNTLQLVLGPQIGLKVHKFEDSIRNFAYSGVGGIEVNVTHEFFIDARYTYGLSNNFDKEKELDITANNTNIQIGIGYKF